METVGWWRKRRKERSGNKGRGMARKVYVDGAAERRMVHENDGRMNVLVVELRWYSH